jgi:chromosome segregation ATPase
MADPPDLDKLKADFKKLQDDIATLSKQAAVAQAAIKIAEAQRAEVAKATEGYDKSAPEMQRELDDGKKIIAKKRTIAESEIKDLKDPIDKTIAEFDKAIDTKSKAAAAAADAAAKAAAAADQAARDVQDKQAAFVALRSRPKAAADRLKALKALLDAIPKAEIQDDAVAMYFYAAEATALANDIAIDAPDAYTAQLVAAQSDVEKGKTAAAAKKSDGNKANAAAADARKVADGALASRRADLLKALRAVTAPAPA